MAAEKYLMESEAEALRLDLKTDARLVQRQARWAGIRSGMRVGDFGCGPGKTSFYLNRLVQPEGATVGIDISPQRIHYALEHYRSLGLNFYVGDIRKPLDFLGSFDFIWVRFVLEHYRSSSFEIVKNLSSLLKPGGILCLIDLDYNCLTHFGLSARLENALREIMGRLEHRAGFDPYVGRKLYAYLFDLQFLEIKVQMAPYHLIYGPLAEKDLFNWNKKVEIAARGSGYGFGEYENGFEGFHQEFSTFFQDPRRFTYTPIICCRGRKA
jgi:SAM-dependent methyltransferase